MKTIIAAILALASLAAMANQDCPINPNPTPPGTMYVCMCDQMGNCRLVLVRTR